MLPVDVINVVAAWKMNIAFASLFASKVKAPEFAKVPAVVE